MQKNKKILVISLILLLVLAMVVTIIALILTKQNNGHPQNKVNEMGFPVYERPVKKTVDKADYYVSNNFGDDNNDGSKNHPFKSIKQVQLKLRELIAKNDSSVNKDITVAILGGEYVFKEPLIFNSQDTLPNGYRLTYTAYNNEEVIFNGGLNIKATALKEPTSADLARLQNEAKNQVKVINLFELGLNANDIGKLYAIGGFAQGRKYGEDNGLALEAFYEGKRMTLAKYPNQAYAKIGQIVDYGQAAEHVPDIINWDATPSPRPPKFLVDSEMKVRMQKWQMPNDDLNALWAYGYFYWDWADVSSPITSFNKTIGQLDLKYSSPYGIKENGLYYVYNVFEELDSEGEYYLDRVNGNFYLYLPKNYRSDATITLSLINESVVQAKGIKNFTLDGITISGSKKQGLHFNGDNLIIANMLIKNVGTDGIHIEGFNNIVSDNEITNVGKNGIVAGYYLSYQEGDITKDIRKNGLKVENNLLKNNYIHAYGETFKTGIAGINLMGVGNRVVHNEIFDAPSSGILYAGNEHIIEYNYLHHVVKNSSDAGAIYAGRNLSFFGNVIRYNAIMDIGSKGFYPNGIYFDDGLAGQVAYGNLLVNIPGNGFLIGGGREHQIAHNLIINARDAIHYDARVYEGLSGGWYQKNVITPDARHWQLLKDAKALYANWLKDNVSVKLMQASLANYQAIAKMEGYNKRLEPASAAVPHSILNNNIILAKDKHLGKIAVAVENYSILTANNCYDLNDEQVKLSFTAFAKKNFTFVKNSIISKENKKFPVMPLNLIGRISA